MLLEVLGTNSGLSPLGLNTSFIIWKDNNKSDGILVDCGFTILPEIAKKNYIDKLNTILISHFHQDHCGSAVAFTDYRKHIFKEKTIIGGNDWTALLAVSGGGRENREDLISFDNNFPLELIPTTHGSDKENNRAMLIMDKVFYSGDCGYSLLDTEQAKKADIIIHDTSIAPSKAHANIEDLAKAPAEIKAKTWLIHYVPANFETYKQKAKEYGFAGVMTAGQTIEL